MVRNAEACRISVFTAEREIVSAAFFREDNRLLNVYINRYVAFDFEECIL
jgi:hypothetical protein